MPVNLWFSWHRKGRVPKQNADSTRNLWQKMKASQSTYSQRKAVYYHSISATTNICYRTLQNIRAMDKLNKPIIPLEQNVLKSVKTMVQSCHADMKPRPGALPENLDVRTLRTRASHCVTEIMESHYQWTVKTLADILQHNINVPKQSVQSFAAKPHFNQTSL